MNTTTLRKKTIAQAQQFGGTIVEKAGQVRATAAPKALELGERVRPKAEELRATLGAKTKETRRKVGFWIAGEEPAKPRRWPAFVAAGIGAGIAFFLDPVSGKRRRHVTTSWLAARARAAGRRTARIGRGVVAYSDGYRRRLIHAGSEQPPENDATLAHKVESELFQGLDAPGHRININSEDGVVYLRGVVDEPSQLTEIERRTREITGVRGVVNLLHLPGTPAPTS